MPGGGHTVVRGAPHTRAGCRTVVGEAPELSREGAGRELLRELTSGRVIVLDGRTAGEDRGAL
ncbi:hypothetical protein TPA0910_56210 [Streptomyces hygroscopicus subsp. sporocinereus]|uniref:Uncharacterized protein n=1 Tax=Streptomyces hygroscopicus TaxID=1912 RepID=A0ABQ3U6F9_STRHY|nr:hypothetical protein TPA0910_56210 [Streptomyces hygroscopicus]